MGETEDCPRKPAPDMLQKAMEIIGVDTCIYVGDSEVDVQTAKNAPKASAALNVTAFANFAQKFAQTEQTGR